MGKNLGKMQYTYRTRKAADEAERYWATKAGNTRIRVNKRKGPDTYTLFISF